jgi:hypothetical protein
VYCIHVAHDVHQWRTYVKPVFSLRYSAKEWNLWTRWATSSFPRAQFGMVCCRVSIKMLIYFKIIFGGSVFLIISVGVHTLVYVKSLFYVTTVSCHLPCAHVWKQRSPQSRLSSQSAKTASRHKKGNDHTIVPVGLNVVDNIKLLGCTKKLFLLWPSKLWHFLFCEAVCQHP